MRPTLSSLLFGIFLSKGSTFISSIIGLVMGLTRSAAIFWRMEFAQVYYASLIKRQLTMTGHFSLTIPRNTQLPLMRIGSFITTRTKFDCLRGRTSLLPEGLNTLIILDTRLSTLR